jgi:hypothetical protein
MIQSLTFFHHITFFNAVLCVCNHTDMSTLASHAQSSVSYLELV